MSTESGKTVKASRKSLPDLSWVFTLCGIVFSLLVFLLLLKQEQEASVTAFNDTFSSRIYQLQSGLQAEKNLALALTSLSPEALQQMHLPQLAQVHPATLGFAELMTGGQPVMYWLQPETAPLAAMIDPALSKLAAGQQVHHLMTEQGSLLLFQATGQATEIVTVVQLSELLSLSGLDQLPAGVSFMLQQGQQVLFQPNTTADDTVAARLTSHLMLNNREYELTLGASDKYLDQYQTLLPALVLFTGILLSVLLGAQLRRQGQRLRDVRASRDQMRKQLESINTTDALTGLANRTFYEQMLSSEVRRAVRDFNPLALMLIRIDGYPEYDQHYGRDKQEWMLCQVATVLSHCIARPGDLLARVEPDLFAFVLPSTNENVGQLAERCNQSVKELAIRHAECGEGACVTVSIGLASMQPSDTLTMERIESLAREQMEVSSAAGGGKYNVYIEQIDDLELGFGA